MLARLIQTRAVKTLMALLVALLALHARPAYAADQDETESDTDEGEGDGEAKADPNQPSVYSGGRYTLDTFPLSELDRTLLLIQGVLELRADIVIDMTKGQTFKLWTGVLEGRYGISDTLNVRAGFGANLVVPDMFDRAIGAYASVEGSIMYDLIDWHAGLDIGIKPGDPTVSLFFGLPLKFRILKDKLAIVALDRILTIHTNSVPNADGKDELRKPDLTINIGFLVQAIKQLAIILDAEVTSVGFEGDPTMSVELDAQYTISNKIDVGIELILVNLLYKNPLDDSRLPIDNRAFGFFIRLRI